MSKILLDILELELILPINFDEKSSLNIRSRLATVCPGFDSGPDVNYVNWV